MTPRAVKHFLGQIKKQSLREGNRTIDALGEAYEQAMERIQGHKPGSQKLAERVLLWITSSKRLLTMFELQQALAVEAGDCELDEDNLPQIEDMINVCAGLVTTDKESNIIRLVHHTAQEYFEKTQAKWFPHADTEVATICLTYLRFDVFDTGFCSTDEEFEQRLNLNPLYDYAARYWGHHARVATGSVEELTLSFLGSMPKIAASAQAAMVHPDAPRYSQRAPRGVTGLHLAAMFGLTQTVMKLLLSGHEPNPQDTFNQTPMLLAAANGHDKVVSLLLAGGQTKVNCGDKYGRTPISWAARMGHRAVVQQLLMSDDVDPNSKDNYDQTALTLAKENGHDDIADLLEAEGNTLLTSHTFSKAPDLLLRAARDGNETAVKLFLTELDPDLKDGIGRTPLLWASERGHEAIVKQLLATGNVDVNVEDKYGRSPLNSAITNGHESVVEILLDVHGVRLNCHNMHGTTPLVHAVRNAQDSIIELLLEHGASPDLSDTSSRTPLWHAAFAGCINIAGLLLKTPNVNPDHQDAAGFTPLLCAAIRGHVDVARLLIERGVRVESWIIDRNSLMQYAFDVIGFLLQSEMVDDNFKNGPGLTLLSQAAKRGHVILCKMLLGRGVRENLASRNTMTLDSYARDVLELVSGTPNSCRDLEGESKTKLLLHATHSGHEAVVRLLLEKDADIEGASAEGQESKSPSSWVLAGKARMAVWLAAENGHEAVVRLLVEHDANLEVRDSKFNRTPLSCAAARGHEGVVQFLIENGADVHTEARSTEAPLISAARNGHEFIVWLLLTGGANTEVRERYFKYTPLILASGRGHQGIATLLLRNGANIEAVGAFNSTPLSEAALYGHTSLTRLLIEKGANPETEHCGNGEIQLLTAAASGYEEFVKRILKTSVNLEAVDTLHREKTALSLAAWHGHVAIVRLLLEKGADIEAKWRGGRTPIFLATEEGHEEVIQLLLSKGAETEVKDDLGLTPLYHAIESKNEAVVRILVEGGANAETRGNMGQVPLLLAAEKGHVGIMQLLVEKGADLGVRDHMGMTPLSLATANGHQDMIHLLLETGADLEIRDVRGKTPLSYAADRGNQKVTLLLLTKGADPEMKDILGMTPLSYAADRGNKDVLRLFLEKGIDFTTRDNIGRTPLLLAAENGHLAVVQMLLDKGADFSTKDNLRRTPLSVAAKNGHHDVMQLLLEK